jgi:hypothetical protein
MSKKYKYFVPTEKGLAGVLDERVSYFMTTEGSKKYACYWKKGNDLPSVEFGDVCIISVWEKEGNIREVLIEELVLIVNF